MIRGLHPVELFHSALGRAPVLALMIALGAGVVTRAAPALAEPPGAHVADDRVLDERREVDDDEPHYVTAGIWMSILLAIPGAYYWNTQDEQEIDWTHPSWSDKLSFRAVRFDTNLFHVNALRHPFAGVGDYQIARSNGFGPVGSTASAYLAGLVWEYLVEYYEDPSLNDLIMNGAGGLALGEPFYQVGQLWRSSSPSIAARIKSAAASPFAGVQDLWRKHRFWPTRLAWYDAVVYGGALTHRLDDGRTRNELTAGIDVDVVRHNGFVIPGAHSNRIATGAWSRVVWGGRLGDNGAGTQLMSTWLRTRTSLVGSYTQDDAGNGRLLALGAAFTYRRDRLAGESDYAAIAHLIGPQLQLSHRSGDTALRFDLAGYVDFGMVDAHVFSRMAIPPPPPYISTLQVQGYYHAGGGTLEARLRGNHGPWYGELELTGHRFWSLDFADRVQEMTPDPSRPAPASAASGSDTSTTVPLAPHGSSDYRVYGHAALGVRSGTWGLAATLDTTHRGGWWQDLERRTSDWTLGVIATANL